MKTLTLKEIFVIAFAIFATHFGIGFVIFPVFLGYETGSVWPIASLGYLLVGILVVMMAYYSIAINKTDVYGLGAKVFNPVGGKIFGVIITLLLPVFIVPRVASAGYEMAWLPFFPETSKVLFQLIYFSLVIYVCYNPSKVIDRLGQILAPVLIIATTLIIIKGAIIPISPQIGTGFATPFSAGIVSAYNNMDALAAIVLGGWLLTELGRREVEGINLLVGLKKVIVVAAVLMAVVQVGEIYLGSTASGAVKDATIGSLPVTIVTLLYGQFGKIMLGVLLMLATFTTCVGLAATSADSFNRASEGRLKYKQIIFLICFVGFILSLYGLDNVVELALPWLFITYPAIMVIVISASLQRLDKNRMATAFAAYTGLCIGIMEAFGVAGINVPLFVGIIKSIPLADFGLAWLIPSLAAGIIGEIIGRFMNKKVIEETPKA